MESIGVRDLDLLEDILDRGHWANGKNSRVDHLYQTGACSRFPKENIYGIYLADKQHSWMAFWMAVTDRQVVRKRALRYLATGGVGSIDVSSDAPEVLLEHAYLYLFDPAQYAFQQVDIRDATNTDEAMRANGFELREITRRGSLQQNYFAPSPCIVHIDRWQLAVTGVPKLFADIELVLMPSLINQVRDRVRRTSDVINADYLIES